MNTFYIFDLCENSIINYKDLNSFGFIIETALIDYKLFEKIYLLDSNPSNPNSSLNETDALLNEYLSSENIAVQTSSSAQTGIRRQTSAKSLIQENVASSIPMITEDSNLAIETTNSIESTSELVEIQNKNFIEHLNTYDQIYNFQIEKIRSKKTFKFLGQVLHIYDMELKLFCTQCCLISNMCKCSSKLKIRIDFQAKFLIDDHTGHIKVNYKNGNLNLNDKKFSPFIGISSFLFDLLKIFGSLRLPNIPICLGYNQKIIFSEIISRKLINVNLSKNAIEFMKVVHDYLYQTFLFKYYQFEVPNTNLISKKLNKDYIYTLKETNQQYGEYNKDMSLNLLVDCSSIESFNTIFNL
jgi:hypothetical protein